MNASPVELIHGEESFLVDRELRQIEEACKVQGPEDLNREAFDAAETAPSRVTSSARTMPFMGERRLIIVKNADKWSVDQWETLTDYAENPNPSSCVVLVVPSVDKRRAWWKKLSKSANVRQCSRPPDNQLHGWIKKLANEAGLKPGPEVIRAIELRVGSDLQLIWREVLKLQAFAGEDGSLDAEDVRVLVAESKGHSVFVFCDAVGDRNLKEALRGLRRLQELGEAPLKILFMIARHFRILWKAKAVAGKGGRQAAKTLGLPDFVAKKAMRQSSKWDEAQLDWVFARMLGTDLDMKSGGGAEVLEKFVMDLCRGS